MPDLTTARDRAVGVGAVALANSVNDRGPDDGAYDLATVVVDALLTHPELLRALAGTVTADELAEAEPNADDVCGSCGAATTKECRCWP